MYAAVAPKLSTGKWTTPRPISSSGLKAILIVPWGISGVRDELRGRSHDLRDAGLVVGAEERRAVGRDQVVPDVVLELGRFGRANRLARVAERDVAAFVMDPLRRDAGSAHLARRIDVREERDRRHLVVDGGRERRGHVAVLVDRGVREPDLLELVAEEAQQVELFLRARVRLRLLVGLRVDADVAAEALGCVLGEPGDERRLRGHRASVRSEKCVCVSLSCTAG